MKNDRARWVRQELTVLSHSGSDWATMALKASKLLRSVVPFDHACWHSMDPATQLVTGAVKEKLADDPRNVRYEFSVEDVNKFSFLARSASPVGVLSEATHGNLLQSPRFRDLLQPIGIAWELRACFRAGGVAWGACGIYRGDNQPDFDAADAAFMAEVSRILGEGFRRSMLLDKGTIEETADGPGLLILDDQDATVSITPAASRWLDELVDIGDPVGRRLPSPVYAVAARAREMVATSCEGRLQARARSFTRAGQWLLLHGVRLEGMGPGLTAVIIEPARPADVALLVIQAYGLSEREREITHLVLRGFSTKQIALDLNLSPLTVQDYLKAVFKKLSVRSRRELTAKMLFDDTDPKRQLAA
jgi:DNA-binding CsgD family transcriptional regulator